MTRRCHGPPGGAGWRRQRTDLTRQPSGRGEEAATSLLSRTPAPCCPLRRKVPLEAGLVVLRRQHRLAAMHPKRQIFREGQLYGAVAGLVAALARKVPGRL